MVREPIQLHGEHHGEGILRLKGVTGNIFSTARAAVPDPLEKDDPYHQIEMEREFQDSPGMTLEQRVDYIYRDLVAVSSRVRRSMLVYNCVASDFTTKDQKTGQQVVRRVLWMTTSHPFFPVTQRLVDSHYPGLPIHRSSLAGIPMRGVDSDIVKMVADVVWAYFVADTDRYPVYDEDGTKLDTMPLADVSDEETPAAKLDVIVQLDDGGDEDGTLFVVDSPSAAVLVKAPALFDHEKKE